MKTIGIIGTRRRYTPADWLLVYEAFCQVYEEGDRVCSGMCKTGADQFAVLCSDIWDTEPIWHWAKWHLYGRGAGFKRNGDIARDSDVLIACIAADRTGGTEDTIRKYSKMGKTRLILV